MRLVNVPRRLRANALEAGNGELLWPASDAMKFSDWLAGRGLAILGGEVYRTGLTLGWGTFQKAWDTDPGWQVGEPWQEFVERGRAQAARQIGSEAGAEGGSDSTLFFLAASSESDYVREWFGPSARASVVKKDPGAIIARE